MRLLIQPAAECGFEILTLSDSDRIRNLIDLALGAVLARKPARGADWLQPPTFNLLDEERVESRFDDRLPVLRHLERALGLAPAGDLRDVASELRAVLDLVRWSQNPSYDTSKVGQSFLDGYAYGGIAGPDCPLCCSVPRLGFLLMGPGVTYEDHKHGPREFYLPLTPGACWRLDCGEWAEVKAGELVLHEPWQMHAMMTGDEPMLAFAGWLEDGKRTAVFH